MIFLAAMLWPRPRHPRVGRVLGCEDFDKDVDEDVDKDVDEDIIEDVYKGADYVNEHEYMNAFRTTAEAKAFRTAAKAKAFRTAAKAFQTVAMAKASQSRPSPWPRSIVNDGNCSLASSSILIVIFGVVRLFLALHNVWSCPPLKICLNNYQ